MKIIRNIYIIILLAAVVTAGYLYFTYREVSTKPLNYDSDGKVKIEVTEGMSGLQVLDELASKGVISKKQIPFLRLYIKLNKVPSFKEGTFSIPKDLTAQQLFETLQKPENTDIWVTIPEGLRMDEIATIIEKEYSTNPESVFKKSEFLRLTSDKTYISKFNFGEKAPTTLEGYLFPDKYLLPVQATEDYIIQTLVGNFERKTGTVSYNDLILASIVEREGYSDNDRPMIADILERRLKEGWLLQVDAAYLYYYKDWKHVITVQDKEKDHAYNTYKRPGLPPTPICNPGLSAINSVRNPKANDYYYYLHDSNREAHYAKTYQGHLNNIAQYLR